jgi:hypothetical protein
MFKLAVLCLALVLCVACDSDDDDAGQTDAGITPLALELDLVFSKGEDGSRWFRLFYRNLDGACCDPESGFPQTGQCTVFTDGYFCCAAGVFRCLTELRLEQAGEVVVTLDLTTLTGEAAGMLDIATGAAELVLLGCGGEVRVPFQVEDVPLPALQSVTRTGDSVEVVWTEPAAAQLSLYRTRAAASFDMKVCKADGIQALLEAPTGLDFTVTPLAAPQTVQTPVGQVRVWNGSELFEVIPPGE